MLMKRFLFFTLFFLVLSVFSEAQQVFTLRKTLELDLSKAPKLASRNQQWIYFTVINDQQKGDPLRPAFWDFQGNLKLEGTAYRTSLVSLKSDLIASKQPLFYRGMRIDDVVRPDVIKGSFVLRGSSGNEWKRNYEQQLSENENDWIQISHVDLYAPDQKIIGAEVSGYDFSEERKNLIEERVQLINRFYASVHLFHELLNNPD